jgi:hypothetical protein
MQSRKITNPGVFSYLRLKVNFSQSLQLGNPVREALGGCLKIPSPSERGLLK